jgi:DNA-directed RNA polymerase alpha subunit
MGNWRHELLKDLSLESDKIPEGFDESLGLALALVSAHSNLTLVQLNIFKLYYIGEMSISEIIETENRIEEASVNSGFTEVGVKYAIWAVLNELKKYNYDKMLVNGVSGTLMKLENSLNNLYKLKRDMVVETIPHAKSELGITEKRVHSKDDRMTNTDLEFSIDSRTRNLLFRHSIRSLEQLAGTKVSDLKKMNGMGEKALSQIIRACSDNNIELVMS